MHVFLLADCGVLLLCSCLLAPMCLCEQGNKTGSRKNNSSGQQGSKQGSQKQRTTTSKANNQNQYHEVRGSAGGRGTRLMAAASAGSSSVRAGRIF